MGVQDDQLALRTVEEPSLVLFVDDKTVSCVFYAE